MGVKNDSFWTEIGLGFGQPSDTPHPHPEFPGIPPPGNSIFPYFTETVPTESRMLQYDLLRNPHRNSKNFQVCQRLGDSCASIVKLVSTYCMLYESRLKIFWMKSMTVSYCKLSRTTWLEEASNFRTAEDQKTKDAELSKNHYAYFHTCDY